MYSSAQYLPLFSVSRHGSAECRGGPLGGCPITPCNDPVSMPWFVVDWPFRTPAGCKQIHGGPCEVAMEAQIEERCACCSGSSPTTGAGSSRAPPTRRLASSTAGQSPRSDWRGGGIREASKPVTVTASYKAPCPQEEEEVPRGRWIPRVARPPCPTLRFLRRGVAAADQDDGTQANRDNGTYRPRTSKSARWTASASQSPSPDRQRSTSLGSMSCGSR